jgi:hypothetical protein
MHEYDKSSKWLIQHYGDSILRLAGIIGILSWRPLQSELVQPRRLPDGLIEALLPGRDRPDLFILEIATYPESRLIEQAVRDAALVYLDRGVLPEVFTLILHPKGKLRIRGGADLQSPRTWTRWRLSWKVVELWNFPARDLLDAHDVGLVPWAPLAHFDGSPEELIRRCREHIDQQAPPGEHENLLAVTQVLTGLRYNDPKLFHLLGGREAMLESPVLQEYIRDILQGREAMLESSGFQQFLREREQAAAEKAAKAATAATKKAATTAAKKAAKKAADESARRSSINNILIVLSARFGDEAQTIASELNALGKTRFDDIVRSAATCPDLASFRKFLAKKS